MKNKKFLVSFLVFVGLSFFSKCFADIPGPRQGFSLYSSGFIIFELIALGLTLILELFFGWSIYFKQNRKALFIIFLANIISQPLLTLTFAYLNQIGFFPISFLVSLIILEFLVVILEMLFYKIFIDTLSIWEAFKISLILNVLSITVGFIILSASIRLISNIFSYF